MLLLGKAYLCSFNFEFGFVAFLDGVPIFSWLFAMFGYHRRTQLFLHFQSHPRGHVCQTTFLKLNCKVSLCHPLSLVQGHLVIVESISGRQYAADSCGGKLMMKTSEKWKITSCGCNVPSSHISQSKNRLLCLSTICIFIFCGFSINNGQ